jgi:hypothetical protein
VVGEMDISYDVFELPGEPGLSIATYGVDEDTESADRMVLLGSWAATREASSAHRPAPDV